MPRSPRELPMPATAVEHQFNFCPRCAAENTSIGAVPFRCVECGFADFFGPVAAVGGLIINEKNEVLLVRRARNPGKGKWGLPGGFVDRGESVEQALVREIVEETKLVVTRAEYLMTHPNQYNYGGVVAPVIDLFYVCHVDAHQDLELAPEELEHFEWTRPRAKHLENMAFHSNRLAIEFWMTQSASEV
jgi:mutator protein MutT